MLDGCLNPIHDVRASPQLCHLERSDWTRLRLRSESKDLVFACSFACRIEGF